MKYTILINQFGAHASGLIGKTDFNDWAIVEYIRDFYSNPASKKRDDHVWINYGHLLQEMPLMTLNKKSSVSNRMRKIEGLGLVTTLKDEDGKLYAKLTTMAYQATTAKAVPMQEHPVPMQEHPVPMQEHPVPMQEHPVPMQEHPVPEKVHRTDHYLTDYQEQLKDTPKPPKGAVTDSASDAVINSKPKQSNKEQGTLKAPASLNREAWQEYSEYRKSTAALKKNFSSTAAQKAINLLVEYSYEEQQAMVDTTIINGWKGVFAPKPTATYCTTNQPAIPHDMPIDEDGDIDVIELARRKIAARQESMDMFGF